jgi:hypothetical protein
VDYSPWLVDRVQAHDAEAIADFVWEIVQANPGVGVGTDGFREHWKDHARKIFMYDLGQHLDSTSTVAFDELRAALVLILLHDNFSGFIIASDAPRYLATVMLPHVFHAKSVEALVTAANEFIRHMRKDTPYWLDVPLYRIAGLNPWENPPPEEHIDFLMILGKLPFASRTHLFDFTFRNEIRGPSTTHIADRSTSYPTRMRGIDAEESTRLLMDAGILMRSEDPVDILKRMKVIELKEFLSHEGVVCSKSLKKVELIALAAQECPQAVAKKGEGVLVVRLSPRYLPSITWAHRYIEESMSFFQVWLGFALQ